MCEVVQGFIDKGREEGLISAVRALMENGFSVEKALELLKVPQADRDNLRERLA